MKTELPKKDIRRIWTHNYYLVNKDIICCDAILHKGAGVVCSVVDKKNCNVLVRDICVHGEWVVKPEDLNDIDDYLEEETNE